MVTLAEENRPTMFDADCVFKCESTDTKPTVGFRPNSYCFENDTAKWFYFTGTEWKEVGWNA